MKESQKPLQGVREVLAQDIADATDEEILAQFAQDVGSPEENAARMRSMFEKTAVLANKGRLLAARAGVVASRASAASPAISIADARARLRHVLEVHAHDKNFTLAARKESELTDADVLDMLQAMHDLGIIE